MDFKEYLKLENKEYSRKFRSDHRVYLNTKVMYEDRIDELLPALALAARGALPTGARAIGPIAKSALKRKAGQKAVEVVRGLTRDREESNVNGTNEEDTRRYSSRRSQADIPPEKRIQVHVKNVKAHYKQVIENPKLHSKGDRRDAANFFAAKDVEKEK